MRLPQLGVTTVSFSGVDGAGKSTQIERLCAQIEMRGLRVQTVRFWDDVATLRRVREQAGYRVFKGEKGIGAPGAPVKRRDKNVRGWPMTCLRLLIYFLDALSLRKVFRAASHSQAALVIFDRYIYDEVANLNLNRPAMRIYARFLAKIVPKTNLALVLDADPLAARERKPEYPLEFLRFNREAYLRLSQLCDLTLLPPLGIEETNREILSKTLEALARNSSTGHLVSNEVTESPKMDPTSRRAVF